MFIEFIVAVLGLQFAYTHNLNLAYAFLMCTHASCTCLVRTQELCMIGLTSPILRSHASLHACEIKTCHVVPLLYVCSVKFKLSCTVCLTYYIYIPSMYHGSTFFGSKILHVYLCRSILFSFISISTK